MLSKQLATIPTDAPVPLDLPALKMGEPDSAALRELYAELGFTSLLRELAPLADAQKTDYAQLELPSALQKYLHEIPRGHEAAAWLALDAQDSDEEGFGTRVLSVEVSTKPGHARIAANDVEDKSLAAMKDWLADPKRPKIVHDPKLFQLLAASRFGRRGSTARRRGNQARHDALFLLAAAHHRESRIRRSRPAASESHAFRRARRTR